MKATDRPWRPTANGERPESGIGSFGIFGEDELPLLGILPEQMPSRRSLPEEWPLFEGVLAVAMYDLRGAGNRPRNRLRWKACEWVFDDDDAWVFSFVNVCRFLGLDVQATRSRLLKLEPRQVTAAAGGCSVGGGVTVRREILQAALIAGQLAECRDTARNLFGEEAWPAKSAECQRIIRGVMAKRGVGAVDAVIFLAEQSDQPVMATAMLLGALCDLLAADGSPAA